MKPLKKKGQRLWSRRGVLGLLGIMLGAHRLVWSLHADSKPKLSLHEADYYQPNVASRKE